MTEPAITHLHHGGQSHGGNGVITRIVIHDEEYPVSNTSAESMAAYFASTGPAFHGCAHYVVDGDSVQHCVPESQLAYHAPPNGGSIGIEHDGYARFTAGQWATPGSVATLQRSARLTADLCKRLGIPAVWLTPADLLAHKRGITSHANVTAAFKLSTHTDPGSGFPVNWYIGLVRAAMGAQPAPAPVPAPKPVPAPAPAPVPPPPPLPPEVLMKIQLVTAHDQRGVYGIGPDGGVFHVKNPVHLKYLIDFKLVEHIEPASIPADHLTQLLEVE